jgi:hypothetical protein
MADGMLLNCLVHGETPPVDCVFTVEVAKSKTVAILKDVIKEKQQPTFNHISADQLSLWKVSLPLDNSVDKVLKQLVLEDNITKGVQKLLPAKKISSYFTDEPTEEHLHVIVEPPSPPPTGKSLDVAFPLWHQCHRNLYLAFFTQSPFKERMGARRSSKEAPKDSWSHKYLWDKDL